jgi:hypothetical protein
VSSSSGPLYQLCKENVDIVDEGFVGCATSDENCVGFGVDEEESFLSATNMSSMSGLLYQLHQEFEGAVEDVISVVVNKGCVDPRGDVEGWVCCCIISVGIGLDVGENVSLQPATVPFLISLLCHPQYHLHHECKVDIDEGCVWFEVDEEES